MRIDNKLNTYDNKDNEQQKNIYKRAIIIFAILLVLIGCFTFFFKQIYTILIGYVIGSVLSCVLFYLVNKGINEAYYEDLKKAVKKIHLIHTITYLLTFISMLLIFKTVWVVIGLAIGLLLIKMSIFTFIKKNKNNIVE